LCFYKTTLRLRPDSHAERVAACRHESKHCQGVAQCDYILKIQFLILETTLVGGAKSCREMVIHYSATEALRKWNTVGLFGYDELTKSPALQNTPSKL
jgi:hypothetical protein